MFLGKKFLTFGKRTKDQILFGKNLQKKKKAGKRGKSGEVINPRFVFTSNPTIALTAISGNSAKLLDYLLANKANKPIL